MLSARKKQWRRLLLYLLLMLLAGAYLILCLNGRGLPCLFYENFGIRCPSCGASRAGIALLRLDFAAAGQYNPMFAFAFYPIGGLIALQDFALCVINLCRRRDDLSFLRFIFSTKEERNR